MGSLYHRVLRNGERSPIFWCKYYVNGRPVRESTGTDKEKEARDFLKRREGAAADGRPTPVRADRVRYDELAADLRAHYQATGQRNLNEARYRLAHLDHFFRGRRIVDLTKPSFTQYIIRRHGEQASNATINRELAVLRRMLRLGYANEKVHRLPVIERLKEADPRAGFFEDHQYEAVRALLKPDHYLATTIAFTYGWRKNEVLKLERSQLDLKAGTLRLEPGTKNGDGRLVFLTAELKSLLGAHLERIKAVERQTGRIIPYLFPHLRGSRRLGRRRYDFRKAWETACRRAGVPGMLRHDLRRTAVRNLERAGVPRSQAMKITGHRSEGVYRRYAIVSETDIKAAVAKLEARGHISGHIGGGSAKTGSASA
jgi:integrase